MFNARNMATWVIAMVLLTLVGGIVADSVEGLAAPVALGVLLALLLFRNRLFALVRGQVDGVLETSAKALTGASDAEVEPFDADAAFARYMANRVVEDVAEAEAATFVPRPAPRGFGRKGI